MAETLYQIYHSCNDKQQENKEEWKTKKSKKKTKNSLIKIFLQ